MKLTKRAIALLLVIVMLLSAAPFAIFAEEAEVSEDGILEPIADTMVSIAHPDEVYGSDETLTINNQSYYVASFNTAEFGDCNAATLHLPFEGSASQRLSVYVIDNYTADEATLCYNSLPTLTDSMLVGEYSVTAGDNKLSLKDVCSRVSGETFTLVIKGTAHYYMQDFEAFEDDDTIPAWNSQTDSGNPHKPASLDDCFSTYFVGRKAGATGDFTAVTDPDGAVEDNVVALITSNQTWNRMKFFNSFVRDKSYLTAEDLDKVYDVSYRLYISGNSLESPSIRMTHGISESNGTTPKNTYTVKPEADTWTDVTDSITITQEMIDLKSGMLIFTLDGTKGCSFYFDDVTVIERAPTSLASRENADKKTAYISATTRNASDVFADTYVSRREPNRAFGLEKKLLLNGGDDENIVFLTFSAETLANKELLSLSLPIQNDAGVEVEVFLLDGYYVDETALTYNNMPSLSGKTPIGTYRLTADNTSIDLLLTADTIRENFFTLVLRATETSCHSYYVDLEDLALDTKMPYSTATTTIDGVKYSYGYSDVYFFRGGGDWGSSAALQVKQDPHDENNKVLLCADASGRARLFNALSHDDLSEADLAKTYRFSFDIKNANTTAGEIFFGLMESDGFKNYYPSRNSQKYTGTVSNTEWTTVSKDFLISDYLSAVINDPDQAMFYLDAANAHYFDNISVIELNDDGTEKRALMYSMQSTDVGASVSSITGVLLHAPIADTYVSAIDATIEPSTANISPKSDKDVAFGGTASLYVSGASSHVGERVTLMTYRKEAISGGDTVILDLPVENEASARVNIYLLDGYRVNEETMTYSVYETDVKDKMTLLQTETLTKGANKIILDVAGKIKSNCFTLIFCAADAQEHIYVSDFERWTAGSHGYSTDKNALYTSFFNGYDSNGHKSLSGGDFIGYGSHNFYVRGSNASFSYMSVVNDPDGSDNKVVKYGIGSASPRIRFVNSLSFDALTSADVGKTFRFSFRIKAIADDGSIITKSNTMGLLRASGASYEANTSHSVKVTTNGEWHYFEMDYTVKEADLVANDGITTTHNDPMFTIIFSGNASTNIMYYIDDMTVVLLDSNGYEPVVEITATEAASLGAYTASIRGQSILSPVADAYASQSNPDVAYGAEKAMKLGDADRDKKVMLLSFMNEVLDENNYVQLNLTNVGGEAKNVSVYYVTDYLVDEANLTWNTLPDYENNLLCTVDLAEGENKLDVSALRDKIAGKYFTLIFRTEAYTFSVDFDSFNLGQTFSDGKDHNVVSADDSSKTYYHSFYTPELLAQNGLGYSLARRNGILENRKIILDPADSTNQVFSTSTSKDQSYGGRALFYDAIADRELTMDDVGRTFYFTAKVKAGEGNDASALSGMSANVDVTTSKSQIAVNTIKDAQGKATTNSVTYIKNTATSAELQEGWVTLSLIYTIHESHVGYLANNGKEITYPMFNVYFNDNTKSYAFNYLLDDVYVIELPSGKITDDASFTSREANDNSSRFVSMLNDNITVMEATVSSASAGDVFSIVDEGVTHTLLSVKNGKLVFDGKTLCDGKGEAYVLSDTPFKVTAIYDDTEGTVRFAINDKLAFYGANKATYNHAMIENGVGDNAVFGVSGITATKMNSEGTELIGYQKNLVNDTSIRFLTGLDSLYYSGIGFDIERDGAALQKQSNSPYVFTSVTIGSGKENASDYGYNYMTALVIDGISAGGVIKVTPYVMIGENKISGESYYYKLTVNGGLTIEKATEDEVEKAFCADLESLTVDGDPVVGFDPSVTDYLVPSENVSATTVAATPAIEGATSVVSQEGNRITVTVTSFNGKVQKVYTLTTFEKLASEVVNKNGADAIVTYVFDDGDWTTAQIVTQELAPKYSSLTGSFALITRNFGTLNTIEGEEGDGLLEYEFDANGNYVYTKNESNWNKWVDLLGNYDTSGFEAVSHTHTHGYIGEDDNGGSFTYKNTNGDVFTSSVFPKGNITKEYYASNQILRDMGQRALAMVGAGLTAGGAMIDYTESYKALPQTSGAFIGKRTTYTNPKNPSSMLNQFADFDDEDTRFNVLSYMVQHYNTSSTAPTGTSAANYSAEACKEAGVGYWTDYVDKAVEEGAWAAFCFHNIRSDDHTGTSGHFVFQSQADALFAHTDELSKQNKVWVANLTDAMLYVFERATAEVGAYVDGNGNVVVQLNDHEDDTIFNMALTVKVALPQGKTGATLNGEALTSFEDNGVTYVYVDIVPGNTVTLSVE